MLSEGLEPEMKALCQEEFSENKKKLEALEQAGRLVVISPSADLQVTRLEGDMEKLGRLYWMGNQDANAQLERRGKRTVRAQPVPDVHDVRRGEALDRDAPQL